MNDLKFALRQLLKHPGFTAVAVLTLALGIGANTAIFSVLHAVVLRPFSYPESDRILFVRVIDRKDDRNVGSFSYPDFLDYAEQQEVFEEFGGAMDLSTVVTGAMEPTRVKGCHLSPELFDLLRTPPMLGRALTRTDNQRGAERVVVLNHAAWKRFFAEAPDVVGRGLELDGRTHTVVGVMPPTFKFWDAQVYLPLIHGVPREVENTRAANFGLWGVGRVKAGVGLDQVNAELDTIARRLGTRPDGNRDSVARALPLAETVSAQIRPTLLLLFGAVGFVLLIACVNVTNLLLARGAARSRELAVRSALGASRRRIFSQLLMETVPLALLGGVLGIGLAVGGLEVMMRLIPASLIPAEATIRLSLPVLGFTMGISLFAALVAGVLPALQASRTNLNEGLKEGARGTADQRSGRLRGSLIVAEVALALTLLVGAGLLVRDLGRLIKVDPGFQMDHLLAVRMDLPEGRYPSATHSEAFVERVLDRVATLPGVAHAGVAVSVPFATGNFNLPLMLPGRHYERFEEMEVVDYNPVSVDAIAALGVPLISGRTFNNADRAGSAPVVLLNEAAARKYFPDETALGRQVSLGVPGHLAAVASVPSELIDPPWATVVGIVGDVRQFGYLAEPQPQVFVPYSQSLTVTGIRNRLGLLIRVRGDVEPLVRSLRAEMRSLDPMLPLDTVQTMTSLAAESVRPQRFVAVLLGVFAGIAALLAAIGIYSVVSWSVAQRTREVGIRLALGASPSAVVSRLMRQGLFPVGIGLALGLPASLALTRLLASQLAQVKSHDPVTYLLVAVLLIAVALPACWLPARRAARIDPMEALRSE